MKGLDMPTVDRPYAQQPETRAAAARRVAREEQADLLLAMLGLVEERPEPPVPTECPTCGNRLPSHGVCRRGRKCRANAADLFGGAR